MGREVRRVPPGWQHPIGTDGGYKPLQPWAEYNRDIDEWKDDIAEWCGAPTIDNYMPDWPAAEATHFMAYEFSDGTPTSPAFATPEELARWLADNGVGASYRYWMRWIKQETENGKD